MAGRRRWGRVGLGGRRVGDPRARGPPALKPGRRAPETPRMTPPPPPSVSKLQMVCPNLRCRKLLCVPEIARGRVVRCRHCAMRVKVPQKQAAAAK